MDQAGMNRTQLADKLGRTPGWITQLLDGERNKTIHTLSDVFWALGKSMQFSAGPLKAGANTTQQQVAVGNWVTFDIPRQLDQSLQGASLVEFNPFAATVMRPRA
jgi:hypothetical protein